MAKATILELFNKIQMNLGETPTISLAGMSGMNYLIFTTLRDKITDLATEYYWTPLEVDIDIPLAAGVYSYDINVVDLAKDYLLAEDSSYLLAEDSFDVSEGVSKDIMALDKDSFSYDHISPLKKYTFKNFDYQFPQRTSSGAPILWYPWRNRINVYPIPNEAQVGKHIYGRGWANPTLISTASPNATCWVPQAFDTCLLCDIVTYEILHYRGSPQAAVYYQKVYGGPNEEGGIDQMKRLYGSPDVSDGNLVVEPMENRTTGNQQYIQGNILG